MSVERPTLNTDRLILRPFHLSDASRVQSLAGHPQVAATTANIPHPYPDGAAESWISLHKEWFENGRAVQFAIVLRDTHELIGCIDLGVDRTNSKAELGYWVGVDYWNQGYCSEAAQAVVQVGFEILKLNKITSRHLASNPASGKVMIKAGLRHEGTLRREFKKADKFHDLHVFGILGDEFLLDSNPQSPR